MTTNKCIVQGCERPYYAKGYCHTHYKAHRRRGDTLYKYDRILTEAQVADIRNMWNTHVEYHRLWKESGIDVIAKKHRVSKQTISLIINGRTHKK